MIESIKTFVTFYGVNFIKFEQLNYTFMSSFVFRVGIIEVIMQRTNNKQLCFNVNLADCDQIISMKPFQDLTCSAETLFRVSGGTGTPPTAFTRQHGIHKMIPFEQFKK